MKKILYKIEKNKIEKMLNKKDVVIIYDDLIIKSLYNKTTKKTYYPRYNFEVVK